MGRIPVPLVEQATDLLASNTEQGDFKMAHINLGIFVSGRGSNLQAIVDASKAGKIDATVALVISDKEDAYALERARQHEIPAVHVPVGKNDSPEFEAADRRHVQLLAEYDVDLVCLAGYMRWIGPEVMATYAESVLNIHPALLPSFPGAHGQSDAADYGVTISGCTVHFAWPEFDTGPIIIQAAVPVLPDDDGDSLAARILAQEHKIYPQAIQWYAQDRLHIQGRRVIVENAPPPTILDAIISPGLEI